MASHDYVDPTTLCLFPPLPIAAAFVDQAHFGGFMDKSDADFAQGRGNARKDWIENMIAESKKKKAEQQRRAEETETMTKDLDASWKQMWGKIKVRQEMVYDECKNRQLTFCKLFGTWMA